MVELLMKEELLHAIKEWVLPGSTIITDCLSGKGFEHLRVNHSMNFKDLDTSDHTKSI